MVDASVYPYTTQAHMFIQFNINEFINWPLSILRWRADNSCVFEIPVQNIPATQSYCPHISVGLLTYDSISTLIRLNSWKQFEWVAMYFKKMCQRFSSLPAIFFLRSSRDWLGFLSYDCKMTDIQEQYDWMSEKNWTGWPRCWPLKLPRPHTHVREARRNKTFLATIFPCFNNMQFHCFDFGSDFTYFAGKTKR